MINTMSMTIASPLIEVLRTRFQAPMFFGAVAMSELDAVKSIQISCHSKCQVFGDFKR